MCRVCFRVDTAVAHAMASFHFMVDEKQNLNFDTSATTSCEQHAYRGSSRADATAEHEVACFHFMVHELQMPDNSLWSPVLNDCGPETQSRRTKRGAHPHSVLPTLESELLGRNVRFVIRHGAHGLHVNHGRLAQHRDALPFTHPSCD